MKNNIQHNALLGLEKNHRFLLACSGGADSVALFYILQLNGFSFAVAHLNYQLRGEESNKDEKFVRELCKKFNVPCYAKKVKMQAKSVQETARILRYTYFKETMATADFDFLLTAHHLNDKVENSLFRMMRGSGLKGLVSFGNTKKVKRPLLSYSKLEILSFLAEHQIKFREDTSNLNNKYARNTIRNLVIPAMQEYLPNVPARVSKTIEALAMDYKLINELMGPYVQKLKSGILALDFDLLGVKNTSFWYYLLPGLLPEQCLQLVNAINQGNTMFSFTYKDKLIYLTANKVVVMELSDDKNDGFTLENKQHCNIQLGNQLKWTASLQTAKNWKPEIGKLYLDVEHLVFPLTVCHPKVGDKIQVLGMQGHKLISDLLNEYNVPAALKPIQWVIKDFNNQLIAVLPYRIADSVKVSKSTKEVWVFEFEQNK